jgi:hypothetical protein
MVNRSCIAGLAFVLPLLWLSTTHGQAVDPREVQARKDCLTGKYEAGSALLAELFAETANPNFIYNQARCYEQNARPVEAVNRFREYLRIVPNISGEEKAEVERHLAECRSMQAEQEEKKPMPELPNTKEAPVPAATIVASAMPPTSPAEVVAADATKQAQPAPRRGVSLQKTGIVLGAVGVAGVASGVVFSVLTSSIKSQVESNGRSGIFDPDKDARGHTYAALQWVGYGVGAAGIAAGAITYYYGYRAGRQDGSQAVALFPVVAPGHTGVALQGSF